MDAKGISTVYQMYTGAAGERIAILTDLNPYETREFRFANADKETRTDLKVEENLERVMLTNHLTGISLRKSPAEGQGTD